MNNNRMLKAIDIILEVDRQKKLFDLNSWFSLGHGWHDCDTAACAMGWICRSEWALFEGLDVKHEIPHYQDRYGIEAAAKFFDISFDMAERIFMPGSYGHWEYSPGKPRTWVLDTPTAADVARRMMQSLVLTEVSAR